MNLRRSINLTRMSVAIVEVNTAIAAGQEPIMEIDRLIEVHDGYLYGMKSLTPEARALWDGMDAFLHAPMAPGDGHGYPVGLGSWVESLLFATAYMQVHRIQATGDRQQQRGDTIW